MELIIAILKFFGQMLLDEKNKYEDLRQHYYRYSTEELTEMANEMIAKRKKGYHVDNDLLLAIASIIGDRRKASQK